MQKEENTWVLPDGHGTVSWMQDVPEGHFEIAWVGSPEQRRSGCGNPWNAICKYPAVEAEIRASRPETPKKYSDLYVLSNASTRDFTSRVEFLHDLAECVGSDCWVVFSRDRRTHRIHRVFYNIRDFPADFSDATNTVPGISKQASEAVRKQLYQESETELDDSSAVPRVSPAQQLVLEDLMTRNLELILVYGQVTFYNTIYWHTGEESFHAVYLDGM